MMVDHCENQAKSFPALTIEEWTLPLIVTPEAHAAVEDGRLPKFVVEGDA